MNSYISSIKKVPILTKEEETELFIKYRDHGDLQSYDKLVLHNLRFVVHCAQQVYKKNTNIHLIDLIQEGSLGLLHAINTFDYTKSVRFVTYAVYHIKGNMKKWWVDNYGPMKLITTKNGKKVFHNLHKYKEAGRESLSVDAKNRLANDINVSIEDIDKLEATLYHRASVIEDDYIPYGDEADGGETFGTAVIGDNTYSPHVVVEEDERLDKIKIVHEAVRKISEGLDQVNKFIMDNRILSDNKMTFVEVGEKFGISCQAVQQRETTIKKKISAEVTKILNRNGIALSDIL